MGTPSQHRSKGNRAFTGTGMPLLFTAALQVLTGCGGGDGTETGHVSQPLSAAVLEAKAVSLGSSTAATGYSVPLPSIASQTAFTAADVLAALKVARSRSPNADPDGPGPEPALPVGHAQTIRLDVNGDGAVTVEDARLILNAVIAKKPSETTASFFNTTASLLWTGDSLEGAIEACQYRSTRGIAPIVADVNKDGVDDFVLPIGCYQGPDPMPGEKHNRKVIAAWKMFCSNSVGLYDDCTSAKFGTPFINATGSGSGGGSPYTHVMERPRDINGDGFPDFWYALSRDDGRPGFDWSNADDLQLLINFCGPRPPDDWEWDCTRKSNQTVLLSQPDGTYKVVTLPWGETNTSAVIMLPNLHGTYDAFSFNYGRWRAARLMGSSFIDVTSEYQSYENINEFAYTGAPYVRGLKSGEVTYVAKAGAPLRFLSESIRDATGGGWGFSLWKWIPGVGFELSDYWVPAASDTFVYQERSGASSIQKYGAYIRGHATFFPRWHFFNFATLDPSEGPVLIVSQESGTTAGDFFRASVVEGAVYSQYDYSDSDNRYRYTELSPIEAFYIRNGKLIPREKSVVAGDAVWNNPGLEFSDINLDGFTDAVGVSGHQQAGKLYLNDGTGTLHKVYTTAIIPTFQNSDSRYQGGFGWSLRRLGRSKNLSLLYWGTGFKELPTWAGSIYVVPDLGLLRSTKSVDALPIHTPQHMQVELQQCLSSMTWIDQCSMK